MHLAKEELCGDRVRVGLSGTRHLPVLGFKLGVMTFDASPEALWRLFLLQILGGVRLLINWLDREV